MLAVTRRLIGVKPNAIDKQEVRKRAFYEQNHKPAPCG